LWSNGIQAAAYLGSSPGREYLRVIRRYSKVVLWIPDVDPETSTLLWRKGDVHKIAKEMGILLVEYKLEAKDAAELVGIPHAFERIYDRVEELRRLI
jgi:hypothetical protein